MHTTLISVYGSLDLKKEVDDVTVLYYDESVIKI